MAEAVAVLDVGKTHAKLSLVGPDGAVLATRSRANATEMADGRPALDAAGVEAWMRAGLKELAGLAEIIAIAPVAHGATAALVAGDRLAAPVLDYEAAPPADVAAAYAAERDPFEATLSPPLPQGLNLGLQLFWQEQLYPELWPGGAQALLWPQYWAWRLSGERAAEATSLGCHTDLWRPYDAAWSVLAERRGWDQRLGPLRPAAAVLGPVRKALAEATGLPADCRVLCGLHDNNASLNAVRGFAEVAGGAFTLVSTGTWFVTFQSGREGRARLDAARDTLANVDVEGRPVPSARFMGGREYAVLLGDDMGAAATLADAAAVVAAGVLTRPAFASGGPFPGHAGALVGAPETPAQRAALASLHLALMSDVELDLVGAEGPVVIEGRFADDPVFPAALAALRPDRPVYAVEGGGDAVALGAARLVWPALAPAAPLRRVQPAPFDLGPYADAWRTRPFVLKSERASALNKACQGAAG
ncbi:MAG TPA: carbohydrate kinase [Caulobacteraceae bacterium]|nr:carbohydrate kinase [Caulobacteraceae bacterium]